MCRQRPDLNLRISLSAEHPVQTPLLFRSLVAAALLLHCSPDFDALQEGLNAAGGRATGGTPSANGGGGGESGGDGEEMGGTAPATGGNVSSGGRSSGSAGDSGGDGESAGSGGTPEGGAGGAAGNPQGGTPSSGGTSSVGSAGEGGTDGGAGGGGGNPAIPPPSTTCKDGCLDLYVPFTTTGQTQFFTIQIGDVDLSKSTITALVRFKSYPGTGAFIKLYASSYDFDYYGGVGLDPVVVGQEKMLALDLTGTPKNQNGLPWKNNRVGSFGLQIFTDGSSTRGGPLHVEVEEISISESTLAPWKFTSEAGISEVTVNNYMPVPDSAKHWVAPAQ